MKLLHNSGAHIVSELLEGALHVETVHVHDARVDAQLVAGGWCRCGQRRRDGDRKWLKNNMAGGRGMCSGWK